MYLAVCLMRYKRLVAKHVIHHPSLQWILCSLIFLLFPTHVPRGLRAVALNMVVYAYISSLQFYQTPFTYIFLNQHE